MNYKEGYLSNNGIEKIRSAFANDIYRDEQQNLYREHTQLWKSKDKKVYGYLQSNVKKTVDENVAELAKNAVIRAVMYMELSNGEPNIFVPEADSATQQIISQSAIRSAILTMLKSFSRLISEDYNRISGGQKFRTEHELKQAIHRKKTALGIKENPLEPKY